jgi:hypothetical protein
MSHTRECAKCGYVFAPFETQCPRCARGTPATPALTPSPAPSAPGWPVARLLRWYAGLCLVILVAAGLATDMDGLVLALTGVLLAFTGALVVVALMTQRALKRTEGRQRQSFVLCFWVGLPAVGVLAAIWFLVNTGLGTLVLVVAFGVLLVLGRRMLRRADGGSWRLPALGLMLGAMVGALVAAIAVWAICLLLALFLEALPSFSEW